MVFLFGFIFSLLQDDNGLLTPNWLGFVGLFFILFIYLIRDTIKLNRLVFNNIIAYILILSGLIYIWVGNYILVLPTIFTGFLIIKKLYTEK